MIPLARQHRLPSGDQLVLISLEVWSDCDSMPGQAPPLLVSTVDLR